MTVETPHVVATVGLVVTGLLALGDQLDVVPSALVASVASWWILRTPAA